MKLDIHIRHNYGEIRTLTLKEVELSHLSTKKNRPSVQMPHFIGQYSANYALHYNDLLSIEALI